jgi:hypothetical protein
MSFWGDPQKGATALDDAALLYPEEIDHLLNWPLGTAARLARRNTLPHYRLPDGSIRFRKEEVESLVSHIVPRADRPEAKGRGVGR